MEESFDIPVNYSGKEILLKSHFKKWGYTYRIETEINGQMVLFEPDEENNYRAVIDDPQNKEFKKYDRELLEAVADSLKELLK